MKEKQNVPRSLPAVGSIGLFIIGLAFAPHAVISAATLWLLGGIAALCSGTYIYSFFSRSDLDRYFEDANVTSKAGELPQTISKKQVENGTEFRLRLPAGMSTKDLELQKQNIEEYLDASISITYEKGQAIILARTKELKTIYPFELVQTNKPLEVMLGYSIDGKVFLDISQAIHVLIGAETGGGKSTLTRSIITNLILLKDCILHLVDFKRVEFGLFKNSDRVSSFCTNALEFKKLIIEISKEYNKRLDAFDKVGAVDITSYNNHKSTKKKLKRIVIIIDEFASLMNEAAIKNDLMLRLSQDRCVGIHWILVTQRPDSKVVDGLLKANIPTSIGLKTKDATNSRIIIDEQGCEKLRGKGHALLKMDGAITEFQAMLLEPEQATELIKHTITRKEDTKNAIPQAKRLPPTTIY